MKTVKRKAEVGEKVKLVNPKVSLETLKLDGIYTVVSTDEEPNLIVVSVKGEDVNIFDGEYEVIIEDEPESKEEIMRKIVSDLESKPPHSSHYHQNGLDPLEVMRRTFPPEQYEGFLRGSLLKYTMRYDRKGQEAEDLEKAEFYSEALKRWKEGAE